MSMPNVLSLLCNVMMAKTLWPKRGFDGKHFMPVEKNRLIYQSKCICHHNFEGMANRLVSVPKTLNRHFLVQNSNNC